MNQFSHLSAMLFNFLASYLEWLAEPLFMWLPLPNASAIFITLWLTLFIIWVLSKSIKAGQESQPTALLQKLSVVVLGVALLYVASIVLSAVHISGETTQKTRALAWLKAHLAIPIASTLLGIGLLSLVLGWLSLRRWIPAINSWIDRRFIKKSYHESGVSDIRDIAKLIPETQDYNPIPFWDKKKESFFIGLDPTDTPIYIPVAEWRAQHQQILGTTGFGKGVAVTNQLAQALSFDQSVVVFDPKSDEWAPSVLVTVAKYFNRPSCVIDLSSESPQFNPLFGATEMEIYDLFIGAFGLAERGAESDFYRSKERRVVQQWLGQLSQGCTLVELTNSLTDADYDNAPKLCNDLTEMAMIGCIQTKQAGAWFDILDQGGLIYIIGSVRREPVLRLQKMLLLRIMQRLESRDRQATNSHVTLFLDELKYLLCKPSLQALGTIRDKSANILLAHQSINDLRDVSADLDPEAVKSAVLENTALKIVYRSQDPETAEWIAKRSGTISAHKEMREIDTTEGMAEVTKANRKLIQVERYLIDVNTILSLPKRCSVFFSTRPAQIALTSPIKVKKIPIAPNTVNLRDEPKKQAQSQDSSLEAFS